MVHILGPTKSLASLLDEETLKKAEADKEGHQFFPLRPSSAGYCGRKLAHDYAAYIGLKAKVHEDRKPNIIRLLSLGHSIEYHALQQLKLLPGYRLAFKQQVVSMFTFPSGKIMEGSVDACLWHDDPDMRAVMDIKSVGDRFSKSFGSAWDEEIESFSKMSSMTKIDDYGYYIEDPVAFIAEVGESPLVANIAQINMYLHSPFIQERGIKWGTVYRYLKNSSKHFEIRFKASPTLFNKVKAKYIAIESLVKTANDVYKIKQDHILGDKACSYCPYRPDCYPDATKKEIYASYPGKKWATRVSEMEGADELRQLFAPYIQASLIGKSATVIEKQIMVVMQEHSVDKIKLDDNTVYEIKYLKSGAELRRSKE
jgi:hypothetical protein